MSSSTVEYDSTKNAFSLGKAIVMGTLMVLNAQYSSNKEGGYFLSLSKSECKDIYS